MRILFLFGFIAAMAATAPVASADLKVLTAGAFKQVVVALAQRFTAETGDKVLIDNGTAGALTKRIEAGESFDLVVLTPTALADLGGKGDIAKDSVVALAKVGIGVVVKKGAPLPDISSVDALKATLLAAKSVAYIDPAAGGSSGAYVGKLFERLGIADQIKAKAVLVPGGLVAQDVADGKAEIGIHQISEILAVQDITLVGPLPAALQNYTTYAGALSAHAKEAEAAKAFLKLLAGPDAAALLKDKGMETPK